VDGYKSGSGCIGNTVSSVVCMECLCEVLSGWDFLVKYNSFSIVCIGNSFFELCVQGNVLVKIGANRKSEMIF